MCVMLNTFIFQTIYVNLNSNHRHLILDVDLNFNNWFKMILSEQISEQISEVISV